MWAGSWCRYFPYSKHHLIPPSSLQGASVQAESFWVHFDLPSSRSADEKPVAIQADITSLVMLFSHRFVRCASFGTLKSSEADVWILFYKPLRICSLDSICFPPSVWWASEMTQPFVIYRPSKPIFHEIVFSRPFYRQVCSIPISFLSVCCSLIVHPFFHFNHCFFDFIEHGWK